MITNWEIISRQDPQTHNLLYFLVTDGTEHDARLIAKKLAGYAQAPEPAIAPYVYSFALPADLDEDRLDKIRTAVREGVEQTNKINQFVPGGVLGEPLFNADVTKEDKDFPTFLTLDPSESFFRAPDGQTAAPQVAKSTIRLDAAEGLALQQQTINPQQEQLSSDVPPPPPAKEEKTIHPTLKNTDEKAPEDTPAEETTSAISINDKDMLIKDMEGTLLDKMPLEDILSAETKYDMFVDLENTRKNEQMLQQREQKMSALADGKSSLEETFNIFEQKIKDQTCILDVDDLTKITERITQKDFGFVKNSPSAQATIRIAAGQPTNTPTAEPATSAAPTAQENDLPEIPSLRPANPDQQTRDFADEVTNLNLPQTAVSNQQENMQEEQNPTTLPEEVLLENTILPNAKQKKQEDADLPAITIRGQKLDNLEKTFHLETTINTELIKHQYFKTRPEDAPQEASHLEKTHKTFRQLGKKLPPVPSKANGALLQSEQSAEPVMEENREEKTTFRIRRINQEHPAQPTPPAAPAAPAAPHAPQPPVSPTVAKPVPAPATPNTIIEKTKTIDHSIELPLSELKKHNWPLEVPLVPTYTIDNMVISVNRFAHATAISVIDSPGKLYNPLVLHGTTGTGKTHFLHAIGYALSKKYGQENIFITNGVRLSRGIQRYVMEGNIEKFEKFMDSVKAILIDDIHLIAINEQNREHISKLLNKFLKEQKQIIITSKYPPESLAKLEELIRFKLDSGWISELKTPQGNTHFRIVKKMLMDNGINVTDTQITDFFGAPHMTLGTVQRSIRRVKVLEKLVFPVWKEEDRSQARIFEKLLATGGEDETSAIIQQDIDSAPTPTLSGGDWGRIGFFYPQNSSHMMNWMVYALEQRAKELGIKGGFEIAVRSSYATENVISSAFKIANLCDNKKLKGAVILGPSLQVCEPSIRENFYDILTHMLEVMLIRCGIINYEDVKAPSTYVKILSELLR